MWTKTPERDHSLEAAMALLIRNQAQAAVDMEQTRKQFVKEIEEIRRILARHEVLLARLPDAIREKIGFKQ